MWREGHLPALHAAEVDDDGRQIVEYGSRMRGLLEELEKAHVYIEQLNNRNKQLEAEIEEVRIRLGNVETRLRDEPGN